MSDKKTNARAERVRRLLAAAYDSSIVRDTQTPQAVTIAAASNWDIIAVRKGGKIMLLKHASAVRDINGVLPGGYNTAAWDAVNALMWHGMITEQDRRAFIDWVADEGAARKEADELTQLKDLARKYGFTLTSEPVDEPDDEANDVVVYRLGCAWQDVIESRKRVATHDAERNVWALGVKSKAATKRPLSDWDYEELTLKHYCAYEHTAVQWVTTGRFTGEE